MARTGFYAELGLRSFSEAACLQEVLNSERRRDTIPDTLLLVEHYPCITVGRNGGFQHILASTQVLSAQGIKVYETNRGGDVTYHGPGQLVCYPILALEGPDRDVHAYVRKLEEVVIRTLAVFGIAAGRKSGFTGVWTDAGKIGALGIAMRKWVTMHGISLNICPDMRHFTYIVPCGLKSFNVVSMSELLGQRVEVAAVSGELRRRFEEVFGVRLYNGTKIIESDGAGSCAGLNG